MRVATIFSCLLAPILISAAPVDQLASAVENILEERAAFPFNRVVAFGDNLSDNGNGSYAHGVASPGQPLNTIYGHRTWTNGPVAVSYLSDMLRVPLAINYAFGHANGGSKFGATINNTYTKSTAGAPDAFQQLANYSKSANYKKNIGNTMHFLWIGSNDISLKHIYVWPGFDYVNDKFAKDMARQTAKLVQKLINDGAQHVFVPNLYPKNIAPARSFMAANEVERAKLTATIQKANLYIKAALVPFGKKAIYYDVNGYMTTVWREHAKYGITHVGMEFCDGYSQEMWDLCVTKRQGDKFYWMQYLDMTTRVHKLVAQDMFKAIQAHFK